MGTSQFKKLQLVLVDPVEVGLLFNVHILLSYELESVKNEISWIISEKLETYSVR